MLDAILICDGCGSRESVGSGFCSECSHILDITYMNFFEILCIEEKFQLSEQQLRGNFIKKLQLFHPDLYCNKSIIEIERATKNSSAVSCAYSTLLNPISRACYLIELKNIPIPSESNFIMDVIEWNEKIEGSSSVLELQQLIVEVEHMLAIYKFQMEKDFRDEEYNQAAASYAKVKFFMRILDSARKKL